MSGPVDPLAAPPIAAAPSAAPATVDVSPSREATVGQATVRRALPQRQRRTVGPWCFADHFGPNFVTETSGPDIGPHPHMGLHTVTWLIEGEILHRDTLGTEQLIKPGQLNLMTAGRGVAHAEEATGHYRGQLHGVQLWVAQPAATRNGDAAFQHIADLPQVEFGESTATVLVGNLAGHLSSARHEVEMVGVDGRIRGDAIWPLRPAFEYGLIVTQGSLDVAGKRVFPGEFAYLGMGRDEIALTSEQPSRVLLLGGPPFPERLLMWWNFVARSREEIETAFTDWSTQDGRFGEVASDLPLMNTPPPAWMLARNNAPPSA